MSLDLSPLAVWLQRRAENVAVALIATMFLAFLAQIILRYSTSLPIGWTSELTIITWLWLILWGGCFLIRDKDEIRFDLIYFGLSARTRRIVVMITATTLAGLYLISLPAVVDYVTFMKVQKTAYLGIRFDWLFSIYVLFAVVTIVRQIALGWKALRSSGIEPPGTAKPGAATGDPVP